jgi:hypothetical protein
MTDFSKYKNITVDNETYTTVTKLQTKMTPDVKLSRSQVIKTLVKEKARMIYKDASWQEKTPIDCSYCNNQGEVEITEQEINDLLRNTNFTKQ